jgi:uncharacterized OB-fold protein
MPGPLPNLNDVTPLAVEGRIKIPYRWPAGRVGGRFLRALRDEGRLLGLRCEACGLVAVPPRPLCPSCRAGLRDAADEAWIDVGPRGTVTTHTVRRGGSGQEVLALVQLDGADTALLHRLLDVPVGAARSGMRVVAVLAEERVGAIGDLAGFRREEG